MKSTKHLSPDNPKHYHGKPCKNCGGTLKFVRNGGCIVCHAEKTREYRQKPESKTKQREYYNNPERKAKLREYKQTPEFKAKRREYNRKYYEDPEVKVKRREYLREYRRNNPEKRAKDCEYMKWYRTTEKGKAVHRTSIKKANARRKQAEGSHTSDEWLALKAKYHNRCLCCGRHESELSSPIEQDHVIPLCKGGSNWITNIQPLCEQCNGASGKWKNTTDYRLMPYPLCVMSTSNEEIF